MSMLALQNVSKSFGALKVTDDVSFEVPEGQALGIIGPNGAGKSTLFNLITGNIPADKGRDSFRRPRRHPFRPCSAASPASGARSRSRSPSRNLTVYENCWWRRTFGRQRSESEVMHTVRGHPGAHRVDPQSQPDVRLAVAA
jgi:branched-chain amino acid transport system ATP-binding protein